MLIFTIKQINLAIIVADIYHTIVILKEELVFAVSIIPSYRRDKIINCFKNCYNKGIARSFRYIF